MPPLWVFTVLQTVYQPRRKAAMDISTKSGRVFRHNDRSRRRAARGRIMPVTGRFSDAVRVFPGAGRLHLSENSLIDNNSEKG